MTQTKTKPKQQVDPRVWMARMSEFLRAQSFTDEEVETCFHFVEQFVRLDLPSCIKAAGAIQCYFHATMLLADEATRKEHDKFCQDLVFLSDQITNVTYFHPDADETRVNRG